MGIVVELVEGKSLMELVYHRPCRQLDSRQGAAEGAPASLASALGRRHLIRRQLEGAARRGNHRRLRHIVCVIMFASLARWLT